MTWTHTIYFPARTDVRDASPTPQTFGLIAGADWIEFPAGSGNHFRPVFVSDWFRDEPSEFRVALAFRSFVAWPMP